MSGERAIATVALSHVTEVATSQVLALAYTVPCAISNICFEAPGWRPSGASTLATVASDAAENRWTHAR